MGAVVYSLKNGGQLSIVIKFDRLNSMWPKNYKDYPPDSPLAKEKREPGRGIVGCQMSEPNGWGSSFDKVKPRRGFLYRILEKLFSKKRREH